LRTSRLRKSGSLLEAQFSHFGRSQKQARKIFDEKLWLDTLRQNCALSDSVACLLACLLACLERVVVDFIGLPYAMSKEANNKARKL